MTRARHVLAALVLAGTLGACATESTTTDDVPGSTATTSPVVLQVTEAVCADLETVTAGDQVISETAQASVDETSC